MTINLGPEHEDLIAAVEAKLDRAFDQFERGEFLSPEQARADMEQRKSASVNERSSS